MADPERQPRPKRRADDGYRLRVESITYLGDDVASARAIENFLRLSRARDRQRAVELETDDGRAGDGRV
jgi:hypothetical protein